METIALFLESIVTFFSELLEKIMDYAAPQNKEYAAKFVPITKHCSTRYHANCVDGKHCQNPSIHSRHTLVTANSGAGKSSIFVKGSILMSIGAGSLVVNAPAGEHAKDCSAALARANYALKYLNPRNASESEYYNPLKRLRSTFADAIRMSKKIFRCRHTKMEYDFWTNSGEAGLAVVIFFVLKYMPPEHRNLMAVYEIINLMTFDIAKVDRLFISKAGNDADLIKKYKAFTAGTDPKVFGNVLSTIKSVLAFLDDNEIAKIVCHDTISFEEFYDRNVCLMINSNVLDAESGSAFNSIFFSDFFDFLLSNPAPPGRNRVNFIIDEASSISGIRNLSTIISVLRKGGSIALCYQSLSQLNTLYGINEAKNIIENCNTKIYYPPIQLDVARILSELIGKTQYEDAKGITRIRPLMAVEELMRLEGEGIVVIGNDVSRVKLHPYYKNPRLKRLTSLPSVDITNRYNFEMPTFNFD